MAFCSSCGTQMDDNAVFCPSCGAQKGAQAPVQTQAPVYQQPVYQQPVYVKAKIPGRGFGISSLVLGIIGLVYAFILFIEVCAMMDSYVFTYFLEDMIAPILIFAVLSILAVSFSVAGKSRGYRTGVSTSGLVLGIIGLCLYALSILICMGA